MTTQKGIFTVSLDFELYWGVRDKRTLDSYRLALLGARRAIPAMLDLFAGFGVRATWATVGFLFAASKEELLANLPAIRPAYSNPGLDPYSHLAHIGENERQDPFHYAQSLIRRIAGYPGQEIGTHTYSHYYCLEDGQTPESFRADLEAAQRAARPLGIPLRSLVFPRNQCNPQYLPICSELGIVAFRGNERAWMYRAGKSAGEGVARRAARLADSYINLSGHNDHAQPVWFSANTPVEIPSSRFLRPVSGSRSLLEQMRLRRIKADMLHAAQHGMIYHLWWHPHNFGSHPDGNLQFLRQILLHFRELSERHDFVSHNMGEIADSAVLQTSLRKVCS